MIQQGFQKPGLKLMDHLISAPDHRASPLCLQQPFILLILSLLQNSLGSGIYCREELLSLGARASRPHKTWQGRGDWLHRVGRFTRPLALEQRLDKYAGGTPALPGGNPWLARCRSLSRALFCRSILPPSHARLRILQKALLSIHVPFGRSSCPFVVLRAPSWISFCPSCPFVD